MKNETTIYYCLTKAKLQSVLNKYFGLVISNGTMNLTSLANQMVDERPVLEAADVPLVIGALTDETITQVVENHNRVDLGLFSVELAIAGSLEAMDSPLGAENVIYLAIIPSNELRAACAKIVPVRREATAVQVKLENVEDRATHQKAIVGTDEFVLTGHNLSATGEGESLKLLAADGTVAATAVVSATDGCGVCLYAHLAATVPATGDYTLALTTRGYATPGDEPNTYTKSVTAVYVAPPAAPTITKVVEASDPSTAVENAIIEDTETLIVGTNLTGATVKFGYTKNDAEHTAATYYVPASAITETADGLKLSTAFWASWKSELDKTVGGTFQVATSGGSVEKFVTIA